MKRLMREPLFHFFVFGVLLFVFDIYRTGQLSESNGAQTAQVTEGEIAWIKETFTRQWQRPPGAEELASLKKVYLEEKILANEAKALGLDQEDIVIQRRLAQKMEFIIQDTARIPDPSVSQLKQYYLTHQKNYQLPVRISFAQLFFKSREAAQTALAQSSNGSPEKFADSSLLERDYVAVDENFISDHFGKVFATDLIGLAPGSWTGPMKSAYGYHLVQIVDRKEEFQRPFDEVKDQVKKDWQQQQQDKARQGYMVELYKKYGIAR